MSVSVNVNQTNDNNSFVPGASELSCLCHTGGFPFLFPKLASCNFTSHSEYSSFCVNRMEDNTFINRNTTRTAFSISLKKKKHAS